MSGSGKKPGKEPWHAVGIVAGKGACEAALALRGKRYLSRTEAPSLPLSECTRGDGCRCTYRHYVDRRGGPRRADELTGLKRAPPKEEHRERRGRRDPDFGEG